MNVKLLCVYHQPSVLLKNDAVVPIHAGRALLDDKVRQGTLTQAQARWMRENLTGDDGGDNISALNPYVNEMTAVYWAWKNYDKLGDPDYIGLMHYRRQFWLQTDLNAPDYLSAISCTAQAVEKTMAGRAFASLPFFEYPQHRDAHRHLAQWGLEEGLECALEILKRTDPANAAEFEKLSRSSRSGGMRNMFIFPREAFFRYCEWMFAVLLPLEKALRGRFPAGWERAPGLTAEVLTGLYLLHLSAREGACVQLDMLDHEDLAFASSRADRSKEWRRRVLARLLPGSAKYVRHGRVQRIRDRFWTRELDKFNAEKASF